MKMIGCSFTGVGYLSGSTVFSYSGPVRVEQYSADGGGLQSVQVATVNDGEFDYFVVANEPSTGVRLVITALSGGHGVLATMLGEERDSVDLLDVSSPPVDLSASEYAPYEGAAALSTTVVVKQGAALCVGADVEVFRIASDHATWVSPRVALDQASMPLIDAGVTDASGEFVVVDRARPAGGSPPFARAFGTHRYLGRADELTGAALEIECDAARFGGTLTMQGQVTGAVYLEIERNGVSPDPSVPLERTFVAPDGRLLVEDPGVAWNAAAPTYRVTQVHSADAPSATSGHLGLEVSATWAPSYDTMTPLDLSGLYAVDVRVTGRASRPLGPSETLIAYDPESLVGSDVGLLLGQGGRSVLLMASAPAALQTDSDATLQMFLAEARPWSDNLPVNAPGVARIQWSASSGGTRATLALTPAYFHTLSSNGTSSDLLLLDQDGVEVAQGWGPSSWAGSGSFVFEGEFFAGGTAYLFIVTKDDEGGNVSYRVTRFTYAPDQGASHQRPRLQSPTQITPLYRFIVDPVVGFPVVRVGWGGDQSGNILDGSGSYVGPVPGDAPPRRVEVELHLQCKTLFGSYPTVVLQMRRQFSPFKDTHVTLDIDTVLSARLIASRPPTEQGGQQEGASLDFPLPQLSIAGDPVDDPRAICACCGSSGRSSGRKDHFSLFRMAELGGAMLLSASSQAPLRTYSVPFNNMCPVCGDLAAALRAEEPKGCRPDCASPPAALSGHELVDATCGPQANRSCHRVHGRVRFVGSENPAPRVLVVALDLDTPHPVILGATLSGEDGSFSISYSGRRPAGERHVVALWPQPLRGGFAIDMDRLPLFPDAPVDLFAEVWVRPGGGDDFALFPEFDWITYQVFLYSTMVDPVGVFFAGMLPLRLLLASVASKLKVAPGRLENWAAAFALGRMAMDRDDMGSYPGTTPSDWQRLYRHAAAFYALTRPSTAEAFSFRGLTLPPASTWSALLSEAGERWIIHLDEPSADIANRVKDCVLSGLIEAAPAGSIPRYVHSVAEDRLPDGQTESKTILSAWLDRGMPESPAQLMRCIPTSPAWNHWAKAFAVGHRVDWRGEIVTTPVPGRDPFFEDVPDSVEDWTAVLTAAAYAPDRCGVPPLSYAVFAEELARQDQERVSGGPLLLEPATRDTLPPGSHPRDGVLPLLAGSPSQEQVEELQGSQRRYALGSPDPTVTGSQAGRRGSTTDPSVRELTRRSATAYTQSAHLYLRALDGQNAGTAGGPGHFARPSDQLAGWTPASSAGGCAPCASVLSASAYLVDLVEDLKAEGVDSQLSERRPDILALPLTCESAETEVPYLDIALQALEGILTPADGETVRLRSCPVVLPYRPDEFAARAALQARGLSRGEIVSAEHALDFLPLVPSTILTGLETWRASEALGLRKFEFSCLFDASTSATLAHLGRTDWGFDLRRVSGMSLAEARLLVEHDGVTFHLSTAGELTVSDPPSANDALFAIRAHRVAVRSALGVERTLALARRLDIAEFSPSELVRVAAYLRVVQRLHVSDDAIHHVFCSADVPSGSEVSLLARCQALPGWKVDESGDLDLPVDSGVAAVLGATDTEWTLVAPSAPENATRWLTRAAGALEFSRALGVTLGQVGALIVRPGLAAATHGLLDPTSHGVDIALRVADVLAPRAFAQLPSAALELAIVGPTSQGSGIWTSGAEVSSAIHQLAADVSAMFLRVDGASVAVGDDAYSPVDISAFCLLLDALFPDDGPGGSPGTQELLFNVVAEGARPAVEAQIRARFGAFADEAVEQRASSAWAAQTLWQVRWPWKAYFAPAASALARCLGVPAAGLELAAALATDAALGASRNLRWRSETDSQTVGHALFGDHAALAGATSASAPLVLLFGHLRRFVELGRLWSLGAAEAAELMTACEVQLSTDGEVGSWVNEWSVANRLALSRTYFDRVGAPLPYVLHAADQPTLRARLGASDVGVASELTDASVPWLALCHAELDRVASKARVSMGELVASKGPRPEPDSAGFGYSMFGEPPEEAAAALVAAAALSTSAREDVDAAVREHRRDAIVAVLLARPDSTFSDADSISAHLLIDVMMSSCRSATRVQEATLAVQTLVNRALLGLEPGIEFSATFRERWGWKKLYRVWEANRKVFLYPENWLDPDLRDNKSVLFEALSDTLLSGDVTIARCDSAFREYLAGLLEVSDLEPVGVFDEGVVPTLPSLSIPSKDDTRPVRPPDAVTGYPEAPWADFHILDPDQAPPARVPGTVHVFARTRAVPKRYFHRTFDHAEWSAWRPVNVEIDSELFAPVKFSGALFLFWFELRRAPDTDVAAGQGGKPVVRTAVHLAWSALAGSTWRGRKLCPQSVIVDTDEVEFAHVRTEMRDGDLYLFLVNGARTVVAFVVDAVTQAATPSRESYRGAPVNAHSTRFGLLHDATRGRG